MELSSNDVQAAQTLHLKHSRIPIYETQDGKKQMSGTI